MTTAAVVLAAGGGTRFAASGGRGPKVLALVDGEPVLSRAVAAAHDAGLDEVLVVDGPADLTAHVPTATVVLHNPSWRDGIASSLQVAVAHARRAGHGAIVVGLGDQPGVGADAWRAVAGAASRSPIVVATYAGWRANPVRLASGVWDLLPVAGDEGARVLMRERPDLVGEVPCSGDPWDVDVVEDLER